MLSSPRVTEIKKSEAGHVEIMRQDQKTVSLEEDEGNISLGRLRRK
jgi:hypothetical protein